MPSFEDNVPGVQERVTSLVLVDDPTLMLSYPGGLLGPFPGIFVSEVMIFAIILVNDVLQDFSFFVRFVAFCGLVNRATSHNLFDILFFLVVNGLF